ncbi:hypothetical protein C5B42_04660 [Candidatus Cerribacteria bacterium 'Amazon FNV 2010 28 9']|uniref:Pyridoxamine 5'-phosphate oxidase N-terminal domain-containing protein n=1 Tax=Candidatus Cerribacteria bacterium 'Amazon FNV 2010 28 9' TaxID=2081795 RepID=A0A317JRZ1_9BACT|nr:MAG: hypothetical protein C5B42_04660 [Candidatus Cerribacteria bacterium 'Amazon FNV 2010 28 9']
MDKIVKEFLAHHRVCCFSVLLPNRGLHSATMHYVFCEEKDEFYLVTQKDSRKYQAFSTTSSCNAALTIGFNEKEWVTMQMDGKAFLIPTEERTHAEQCYSARYPSYAKYKTDPQAVFVKFVPTWWRYSSFKTKPHVIIFSEDEQT